MDNGKEILNSLKQIEIKQAVTHEKLRSVTERLNKNDKEYEDIEKRVDNHDKIVGGIIIAITILSAMFKFKII